MVARADLRRGGLRTLLVAAPFRVRDRGEEALPDALHLVDTVAAAGNAAPHREQGLRPRYTPAPFTRVEREAVTVLFGGLHWRVIRKGGGALLRAS